MLLLIFAVGALKARICKKIVEYVKNYQFVDEIETKGSFLWQPNAKIAIEEPTFHKKNVGSSGDSRDNQQKIWGHWVTTALKIGGSLEPYIRVTSIMGVPLLPLPPPPPGTAAVSILLGLVISWAIQDLSRPLLVSTYRARASATYRFADDFALMADSVEDLQTLVTNINIVSRKLDMTINKESKPMFIYINEEELKQVETFTFILSIATYSSKFWTLKKSLGFVGPWSCLGRILGVSRRDKLRNTSIR